MSIMELKDFAALYKRLNEVSGRVETLDVDDNGHLLSITVNGFAKSGTLQVSRTDRGIFTQARYQETNHFEVDGRGNLAVEEAFDLISRQAFNWYSRGIARGLDTPSALWAQDWLNKGLLEAEVSTTYRIKR